MAIAAKDASNQPDLEHPSANRGVRSLPPEISPGDYATPASPGMPSNKGFKLPDLVVLGLSTADPTKGVTVMNKGEGPAPKTRVRLTCHKQSSQSSPESGPCWILAADIDARYNGPGKPWTVSIKPGAYWGSHVVDIPPLQPGETRDVRLIPFFGGGGFLQGDAIITRCHVLGFKDKWKKGGMSSGCRVKAEANYGGDALESNKSNNEAIWNNLLADEKGQIPADWVTD